MNIKILILGSNGFFGKNFKDLLQNKNYELCYIERKDIDISDKDKLNNLFSIFKPSVVIHCCGIIGSSEYNKNRDQFEIFIDNLRLNTNILECCKLYKIKKVILFSTYRLFSNDIKSNYNENDFNFNIELVDNNIGYLLSKRIMNDQIKLLNKTNNINIITLILPNIFGIYDNFSIDSRIVPSIITKMNIADQNKTNLCINSHESTQINIIYINDIINITSKCIQDENITGNIIIFNTNNILTLKELCHHIKNLTNFKNNILFNSECEYKETNLMNPDISKFNSYFKNFVFTDLTTSLENTIEYFNLLKKSC